MPSFPINDPSASRAALQRDRECRPGGTDAHRREDDGSADGIAAVQAGKLLATSAQFPKEIGRIAAEKCYDHLAGKPVEKDVAVEVKVVTKENAAEFLKK